MIYQNNYNIQQLKIFAKNYKIKSSGNKKELLTRIFCFLRLSYFVIKIQKVFRGNLQRQYNYFHGPAFFKKELCTNNTDFFSMEEIKEIPYSQFFSYKDVDGFIYGFDIISLYNLIEKTKDKEARNPYNRMNIPTSVVSKMKILLKLSKLLKIPIDIDIKNINNEISTQKSLELRILDLFQNIDALGNYSNPEWFNSLNRYKLLKFMRELIDIWNYRAQLSNEIKRSICPPYGDPFRNFSLNYANYEQNIDNIRKIVIEVLEKLVNSGIDRDSKSLGAYYVLGALTLVNDSAASALPWLFQSLSYF
jgi:hypothetical protein